MQFLVFADIHISEKFGLSGGNTKIATSDGPRRRSLHEQAMLLDWIALQAEKMEPDAILFAGDLYDRDNPTPNEESVALAGMQALADIAPTYCLLGNHTQSLGDDESALASLRAVRHPGIHVVEAPRTIELDGVRLHCLPYPAMGRIVDQAGDGWSKEIRNGKVSKGLAKITEAFANSAVEHDGADVLFSHLTFAGSKYNEGRAVPMGDVACPTSRLPDFEAVVAGHLHGRQQIGGHANAWYVGAPDRWTFGDEGNPAGIGRVEVGPGSANWQFLDYPHARLFETIDPATLEEWHEDGLPADEAARFVRVRGEVADVERLDELERYRDAIGDCLGSLTLEVDVPEDDRAVTQVDPDGGLRAIFDTYVKDRPDAIPEERRDSVFEEVEQIVEAGG